MKIRIRNRTNYEKIILCIFIVIFGEGILSIFIPQIHPVYYLTDLLNVVLFISLLKKRMKSLLNNVYLRFFLFNIVFIYYFSYLWSDF